MMSLISVIAYAGLAMSQPVGGGGSQAVAPSLTCWPESQRPTVVAGETRIISAVSADKLRAWHELLASEPHVAGTPGDWREVDRIADAFKAMGMEVQKHEIWPLLCRPKAATLEVVSPERVPLVIKEDILKEDPFSANPDLTPGWNAYSGSGDVTAEVVYANYGTKEDFKKLAELGVSAKGKIVLARYGGNFRGYKAKFAEEAGAAGLIIFTDPSDSGYCKGIMYPEGGFANPTCIQRGSILTLGYPGDPLTPGVEATKDAKRLDETKIDLPHIPVQPVGWASAQQIIGRMTGAVVPNGWQGGLPFTYRLTGGAELKVRLHVEQERFIGKTYNVIATLKGTTDPQSKVVIGCHHDAWGFGAADPLAGTITLMEAARVLSEEAKAGHAPARSIVFCAWGAEEFGIIGSTEWVEANRDDLEKNGVAYINLDMASMGTDFGCSATPAIQQVVVDVSKVVPQARGQAGETVYDSWIKRSADPVDTKRPRFGDLGGGSDHEAFVCHVGMSAAAFGAGGSQGTSYHSVYDNLKWYRQTVGEDYEPAMMISRMTALTAGRLAGAPVIPLDSARYLPELHRHLSDLAKRGADAGFLKNGADNELNSLIASSEGESAGLKWLTDRSAIGADRVWLSAKGTPGRSWFRNRYVANDEDSGYASWPLPGLRYAVERRDATVLTEEVLEYKLILTALRARLQTGSAASEVGR